MLLGAEQGQKRPFLVNHSVPNGGDRKKMLKAAYKLLLLASSLQWALPRDAVAQDISDPLIRDITAAVKELCSAPDRQGEHWQIETDATGNVLFRLFGLDAGVKFTREEWSGIKDAVSDRPNLRECTRDLTPQFLAKFSRQAADAPLIEYYDPGRQLYMLYRTGVRSRFDNDNAIAQVSDGVIVSFDVVEVRVQWMGVGAIFQSKIFLELAGRWDERPLAYCNDPKQRVQLEYRPRNDCLSETRSINCIIVACG